MVAKAVGSGSETRYVPSGSFLRYILEVIVRDPRLNRVQPRRAPFLAAFAGSTEATWIGS